MKFAVFALLLACVLALAAASLGRRNQPPRSTGPTFPRPPGGRYRYRREAEAEAEAEPSFGWPRRSTGPNIPQFPKGVPRFRREAEAEPSFGVGRRNNWPPRSTGPTIPRFPKGVPRFRREADPQGSIVLQGSQPLSGPDRRPSLDVNYNHRVFDRNGATADAYGGLNIRPGERAQPHIGIQAERNYRNGFIRGFGQLQPGPRGRVSPTLGANIGFRFRRDAEDLETVQDVEEAFEAQEY